MDDCIEFTGPTFNRKGYGRHTRKPYKGRFAHRVAWEQANGPIPENMCVCHTCDNPPCINPNHLFLGSHADNVADRDRKGRRKARGEANSIAKLTEQDVRAIRATGPYYGINRDLANQYGVTLSCIHHIRTRRNWTHI